MPVAGVRLDENWDKISSLRDQRRSTIVDPSILANLFLLDCNLVQRTFSSGRDSSVEKHVVVLTVVIVGRLLQDSVPHSVERI